MAGRWGVETKKAGREIAPAANEDKRNFLPGFSWPARTSIQDRPEFMKDPQSSRESPIAAGAARSRLSSAILSVLWKKI